MLERDPSVPPCNDGEEGGVSLNQLRTTSAISRAENYALSYFNRPAHLSILSLAAMTKLGSTTSLDVRKIVV